MMLQTSSRQSYGLPAALLAGGLILLGLLMMYPGFLAAHTALVRTCLLLGQWSSSLRVPYDSGLMNLSSGISVALKSFGLSWTPGLIRHSLESALTKAGCRGHAPHARWACVSRRRSHQAATSCNGWFLPSMRIGLRAALCLPMIHLRRPSTV